MLKKIVALLTTACIAVTMAAPAFAATTDEGPKITGPSSVEVTAGGTKSVEITTLGISNNESLTVGVSGTGLTVNPTNPSVNNNKASVTVTAADSAESSGTMTIGYSKVSKTVNITVKPKSEPAPGDTVKSVTISGADPFEMNRGANHTFTAVVETTGNAAKTVTWSVATPTDSATKINASSGELTIGASETATTLTVTATATADTSKKDTVTVKVLGDNQKPSNPEVTNVIVTPATASVEKGDSKQFSAEVQGNNLSGSDVTWSIAEAGAKSTISSNGLLTVDAAEMETTLTVTATAVQDTTKKGTATVTVTSSNPDPGVKAYTITVSSAVGGRGSATPAQAKKGESVSVTAVSSSGYEFDFWSANPVVDFADRFAARTSFTMIDEDVTVIPHFRKVDSSSSSSSSSEEESSSSSSSKDKDSKNDNVFGDGSGAYGYTGGGSRNTAAKKDTASKAGTVTTAAAEKTAEEAISKAIEQAISNDDGTANAAVSFRNVQSMSPEAFKAINAKAAENSDEVDVNVTVQMDTVVNGVIAARLYIDPKAAAKLDTAISTSVDTSEKSVTNTAVSKLFDKYFENDVKVVTFGQKGEFGMPVAVAVKVDLTKLDVKNLMFYNYDIATNSYSLIEAPAFFIDNAGYVHFTTEKGGSLIITDSALKTK